MPLNYLLQHRHWRRLVQIGGEGAAGGCMCVYSLELAGVGGVSWPVWDGGVTPRLAFLVSPQD